MKLIFLHGPPAAGKYTIAQCLERSAGVRNLHNHLILDVAKALFDFGSDDFWDLTDKLRLVALEAVAPSADAAVAMTMGYTSDALTQVEAIERLVSESGGEFIPVFLKCDMEELRRRVSNPGRSEMKKINSVEGLERYMSEWDHIPFSSPNSLTVVTQGRSAGDCAEEIIRRLVLPRSDSE